MPHYRTTPRTPYAVVVRYRPRVGPVELTTLTHRKRLRDALAFARDTTMAWSQLTGGQPSPLTWYVIDTRDGTEYQPFGWSRKDGRRVEQAGTTSTLF